VAEKDDTQVTRWGSLSCEAAIKFSIHSQLALGDPQRVTKQTKPLLKLRDSSTVVLDATAEGEYAEFGSTVVR